MEVCEGHAAQVDRDRSCCVEGCPIVVSDFQLPSVLHRPLPFRLKEDTPHRFVCLGHNLRYVDTLRKPMAASAITEAMKKQDELEQSKSTPPPPPTPKEEEKKSEAKVEEEDGEGGGGSSPTETIIDDVVFIDAEKVCLLLVLAFGVVFAVIWLYLVSIGGSLFLKWDLFCLLVVVGCSIIIFYVLISIFVCLLLDERLGGE